MGKRQYSDDEYSAMITAIIGDIYYVEGLSNDTKIARLRTLSEYIIRRLLKHNPNNNLLLGDERTINALKRDNVKETFFWNAYRTVQHSGNDSTHSKKTILATDEDFQQVSDAVIELYAYLFYRFFLKYEFGSNPRIMTSFSLLPPCFRFIVLKELLYNGHENMEIIGKLRLAVVKAKGIEEAIKWVEEEKQTLERIKVPYSSDDMTIKIMVYGMENIIKVMEEMQENAYDFLLREIPSIPYFSKELQPYTTFETAKAYYLSQGLVPEFSSDAIEFNELMEYIYTGRKEK